MFTQSFIQTQIKDNIKAPRHWPLWFSGTGEFPAQMANYAEMVPFDAVIMLVYFLSIYVPDGLSIYVVKNDVYLLYTYLLII